MAYSNFDFRARVTFFALVLASGTGCAGASHESQSVEEESSSSEDAIVASRYRVTLTASQSLFGGRQGTLSLRVRDAQNAPVTTFDLEHTKLFHLVVVSRDLAYFTHLHPTHLGGGRFSVAWTPPQFDDNYHVYAQFAPSGEELQTVLVPLHVAGTSIKTSVPLSADTVDAKRSGRNILEIDRPQGGFISGPQTVHFMVKDAATHQVATDLGTYLGARAHAITVKAQAAGKIFEHAHDMGTMSGGGHGGHGSAAPVGSGHLSFDMNFEKPGVYRVWVQYNRRGTDVTQWFTIDVGEANGSTCRYDDPAKPYSARSADECALIQVACAPGMQRFDDACGCGCAAVTDGGPTCRYDDPAKSYIGHSASECALIQVTCVAGKQRFDDACGCGCADFTGGGHGGH